MRKRKGWNLGLLGQIGVLGFALLDRETPWGAKLLAGLVVVYLLSPIDFLPDFVPFAGVIDDMVIVPLGLWLAGRLIPVAALERARVKMSGAGRSAR